MKSKRKDIAIIILPISLFLGILFLGTLRITRGISIWPEVDCVFIVFYLIWISAESKISKKDYHTEGKNNFDLGTCRIYAFGQGLTFLTALWFAPVWTEPSWYLFFPFMLFFIGVAFRLWSIKTLGEYYSHKVRKIQGHKPKGTDEVHYMRRDIAMLQKWQKIYETWILKEAGIIFDAEAAENGLHVVNLKTE